MGIRPETNPPATACAHCGEDCGPRPVVDKELSFCCAGCRTVHTLLADNGMLDFYRLEAGAGRSQRAVSDEDYAWLDIEALSEQFVRYRDAGRCHVEFELPAIHCIACVWLLERLHQLLPGVRSCQVNFSSKVASIVYEPGRTSLRRVAETLQRIGYPPHFRRMEGRERGPSHRAELYRIGVAGFCFGNIMLLSFPEYFGLGAAAGAGLVGGAMGYILLVLSLPVISYAGRGFLEAAWRALRARRATIDLPIAIGMAALFGRSAYEILTGVGAGYLDSLAGLVFFLLIGRWFQNYSYGRLNFERDYEDYFPLAATRLLPDGATEPVASKDIAPGDELLIRPGRVIPADGTLLQTAPAGIDYSFVTGEAEPQVAKAGAVVYAGGRALASPLRVQVTRAVAESYLLGLWQKETATDGQNDVAPSEGLIRAFTITIILLAVATFGYWYPTDQATAYRAATAVLIIACPCALALAGPFAYGTLHRLLGKAGFFLRAPAVLADLAEVDAFALDKTGTLVDASATEGHWKVSAAAKEEDLAVLLTMAGQSSHPRAVAVARRLEGQGATLPDLPVVEEVTGAGLRTTFNGAEYRIGRAAFCGRQATEGGTFCVRDGTVLAVLKPATRRRLRPGVGKLLDTLNGYGQTYLISGDHPPQTDFWEDYFPPEHIHFRQSPFDKLSFVEARRESGRKVLMVGDGLNDAGALRAAAVGLAVSDGEGAFSPACDGIVKGDRLESLGEVICASRRVRRVLWGTYTMALCYNLLGLSFAVSGTLSPVIAAILMPVSSVSVAAAAAFGAWWVYRNDINHRSA